MGGMTYVAIGVVWFLLGAVLDGMEVEAGWWKRARWYAGAPLVLPILIWVLALTAGERLADWIG